MFLVGAHLVDSDFESSGAIYIFENSLPEEGKWKQIAKHLPEDFGGLRFGKSIGLSGNTLVVGASRKSRDSNLNREFGAAFVFRTKNRLDTASIFNLKLQHGWNLFSLPVLTTISTTKLFGEITQGIVLEMGYFRISTRFYNPTTDWIFNLFPSKFSNSNIGECYE